MAELGSHGVGNTAPATVSRLRDVRTRMARSAAGAGRSSHAVTLVCVTKGQDLEAIRPVLTAGERVFGENRVQEAQRKWPTLRTEFEGIELHLIGPLQTNKVREAVSLFNVIETLDRPKLAEALASEFQSGRPKPELYVQVNTGREPQKAGVAPEEVDGFLTFCRTICNLEISGLMCIPPMGQQVSPHFALLSLLAARNDITRLSMGMSADYELGIQLGATHVRVGSAIFGERPAP
ncbi:MAG: YggS family pyridoxal phosphate-dependent enzyme [Hyphomicrobiales bacterium]|nr:YggS family pyridoxal phosphate-dependent enzyme [Hyphomicrobiales bacterium]